MLKRLQGNILDMAKKGYFDVVVQGCNCKNTMGSGLAKEVKDRYPLAFEVDSRFLLDDFQKLGNYSFYKNIDDFFIVNAYTQLDYLPRGIDHFNYASFAVILEKLLYQFPGMKIGFPYIGMGLAGGDPNRIIPMLEEFAEQHIGSVTLVEFKG